MGAWSIYGKNGQVKATVKKLEYNGEFMGERSITCTLYSPSPISLESGDYITYRGEVFSIDYDPSILKQARRDTSGDGFVYEGIKMNSLQMELVYCKFLDYVMYDNQIHYSSLPNFSFYCETILNLTERIQANLNRLYTGGNAWTIVVNTQNVSVGRINIDVQGMTCWDALALVAEKFNSTFVIRGRTITVAPSTNILDGLFQYGKGNGLRSIARTTDPSQGVVTRLRAMGNTTNMPMNYYRNKDMYVYAPITEVLGPYETSADIHSTYDFNNCFTVRASTSSDIQYRTKVSLDKTNWAPAIFSANPAWVGYSVASVMQLEGYDPVQYAAFMQQLNAGTYTKLYFSTGISKDKWPSSYKEYTGTLGVTTGDTRLMLPGYPDVTSDPYIDSEHISRYGIREESVIFDGSNGLDDIYPTIQGMTAEQARAAGATINLDSGDNGHLDEIVSATQIDDDGVPPAEGEDKQMAETFNITLKDIGFNINDYLSADNATISMRDGKCEGREFEITKVEKSGNKYVLTCNRQRDDSLNRYFPYDDYNLTSGDKFVLLNIEMPELYIDAASQRLQDAAEAYLATIDHSIFTIEPKIDNIKAKRHDDEVDASGEGVKVYDTIYEGMLMQIEDEDLDIDDAIFIDRLTIKEGDSLIPQYEVVLRNEKVKSSIQQIQQQITDIKTNGVGGGVGNVDANAVGQMMKNYGDNRYLRKDIVDILRSGVQVGQTFTSGLLGEGGKFWKDNEGNVRLETDYMTVRKKFVATEVDIQDIHHVGGQMLLTAARMICDSVEWLDANGNVLEQTQANVSRVASYKCYFLATDSDGRTVHQEWLVGDQAFVNTFNLESYTDATGQQAVGNHYYWRLVTGVSNEPVDDKHYIILSATDCDTGSSIPLAGDEMVQLGYRGEGNAGRQSAIIIAGATADDTSPFIREHMGINSYSLANTTYTSLQPGNNFLTGVLTMQAGSTLADGRPINELGTEEGNLVLNSGFTGEYESEGVSASLSVNADTPIYSDPFRYWDKSGDVLAAISSDTSSGMKAVLSGNGAISQNLGNLDAGWYMLSFYANPTLMTFSFAGQETTIPSNGAQRYEFPIELSEDTSNVSLSFRGNGDLGDIMFTKGTISREWKPSVKDNDKAYAEFQSRDFLYRAITEAKTSILGGLVLTQLIKVGNYRRDSNGEYNMAEETGGMSGRYNNDESPFIWGGGSMEQAFYTIAKYAENPNYNATEAEIANMAKFVVTHGGRAILNDIILRGYIHAVGGVFENVQSKNGKWSIDSVGNVTLEGTIKSESGRIAGFRIQGKELTNLKDNGTPEDDAKIVIRNATKGYYAAIGWLNDSVYSSTGNARNVGQFYNRVTIPYEEGAPVLGIEVSVDGANKPNDNVAIVLNGGNISGFSLRTVNVGFPYTKHTGSTDPYEAGRTDLLNVAYNDVYVTTQYLYRTGNALDYTAKQSDMTLFLPHMYLNNDGYTIKIKRGFEGDSSKKVYIIPSTGTYRTDTGSEYVDASGDTCLYYGANKFSFPSSTGTDRYCLNNPGDYVELVYHASLEYTKEGVTYHGIWLEHGLSINSNSIGT